MFTRSPSAPRAALLLACLLASSVSAGPRTQPAGQTVAPDTMTLFRQVVARRALARENPAIARAVQTLRAQGFLPEFFAAVEEVQELQGKVPEVEAKRQAFEQVIEEWLRRFPFKGHHRYSGFRVLTNDWTPGKTNAYIEVVLETRDAATNTYHRLRLRLTIPSRSMQVADYEVLGEA